jgi:hypothetical protein
LATDGIGRRVFGMDEDDHQQFQMDGNSRGIAGLRRSQKSPIDKGKIFRKKIKKKFFLEFHRHQRTSSVLSNSSENAQNFNGKNKANLFLLIFKNLFRIIKF